MGFLFAVALLLAVPGECAARSHEDCDALVMREPRNYASFRCYIEVAQTTGAFDEAARRLDAHLAIDPENHLALTALAYLETSRDTDRAETLLRRVIERFARDGPAHAEVFGRLELYHWLARRGRLDDADEQLGRAEQVALDSGDTMQALRVRLNQASQLQRRSDYGSSERLLRRIAVDVVSHGEPFEKHLWSSLMGSLCSTTGRWEEAIDHFEDALEQAQQLGWGHGQTSERSNMAIAAGLIAMRANEGSTERREAIQVIESSLAEAATAGDRRSEAMCRFVLSQQTDAIAVRRRHLRAAQAITEQAKQGLLRIQVLAYLGESLVLDEPREEAAGLAMLELATELAHAGGDPHAIAQTAAVQAGVARQVSRREGWRGESRERAIDLSLRALDLIDRLRDLQPDHLSRARTFDRWSLVHVQIASHLLGPPQETPQREDLALAFHVLERRRARVLLDEMDAAHATGAVSKDDPLAKERHRLLEQITSIQRDLVSGRLDSAGREEALTLLARLEVDELAVRTDLARQVSSFAALRTARPATLEEIEETLGDHQALLSFHLTTRSELRGDRSWLLVHSSGGTAAYEIPSRQRIISAVELLNNLLFLREGSESRGAEQLYEELLGPALRDLPASVSDLIIAPDDALHRLPFGVLRPLGGGEPLASRFTISLVPSATLWLHWQHADREGSGKPALALADPVLPTAAGSDAWRGNGLAGLSELAALPHARRETRSLKKRLGRKTLVLEGSLATESALKEENLSRFGLIHLATHAVVDDRYPERTAMVLGGSDEGEDGLLQLREVVGLELGGRVVVLSGCRSASGPILGGEGVLGLARAFFVADARAVIGSLWPLRDDEAAAIFDDFYRYLGRGESLAEALRGARKERIAANAPPAAWAGLVLLGDGSFVPFPGGAGTGFGGWLLAGLGAAALVTAGVTIWWSRRRRRRQRLLAILPNGSPSVHV